VGQIDKLDADGILDDGVGHDPAGSKLHAYADDRQQLRMFQEPVLLHASNPHERLYVAALDGTGNDKFDDPQHETNVGLISDQIKRLKESSNSRISGGYVPGPGTQRDAPFAHVADGARGYTVDERAEEMYKKFIDQAWKWKREDPDAEIRLVSVSFSRGSEEGALFARLVEERGIQDPAGARYTYDSHHQIKHVEYTKPPLVPPHQVAQAVAMFDPVGTGSAMNMDRRLPPSVISGIQFVALDEHRGLFKSDRIIDPGITRDGRFAGVYVPGAHSDVGGGYHRDGLSIRTGNFVIDYLNGLSDTPFLAKSPEPDDPRLNVVHHSQEGLLLYRLWPRIDRLQPGGYNEREVSRHAMKRVPDAYNAEPRNETLNRQFERQAMPDGPVPGALQAPHDTTRSELDQWIDRMYLASQNPDDAVWDRAQHEAAHAYLRTADGQQFQQQADGLNATWDMQLLAQQQAAQQMLPQAQGFSR
jgi:hypothetical protein